MWLSLEDINIDYISLNVLYIFYRLANNLTYITSMSNIINAYEYKMYTKVKIFLVGYTFFL